MSFGHWTFLRILWEHDGLTQRALSEEAGVMEPTTFTALKAMERLGTSRAGRCPRTGRTSTCSSRRRARAQGEAGAAREDVNRVRGDRHRAGVTSRAAARSYSPSSRTSRATRPRGEFRAPPSSTASSRASPRRPRSAPRREARRAAPPSRSNVHIPWCLRKALTDDFNSHEQRGDRVRNRVLSMRWWPTSRRAADVWGRPPAHDLHRRRERRASSSPSIERLLPRYRTPSWSIPRPK